MGKHKINKMIKHNFITKSLVLKVVLTFAINCICQNSFGKSSIFIKDNSNCQVSRDIVSDTLSDTILLQKNICKVELEYWNVFSKYESYVFSFCQKQQQFTIKAEFPENSPLMEIKSDSAKNVFTNIINRFYILKTDKIVEKKEKREEEISSDFETISIYLYTNKGEKKHESTKLVSEDYILFFNSDYELFIKMLNELILQYNKLY